MPKLANLGRDESLICKRLGCALLAKSDTCPLRPWGITIFCGISTQRAAAAPAPQGLVEELLRPPQPDAAAVQPSQGAQEPPPESLRSPQCPGKEDPLSNPKQGRAAGLAERAPPRPQPARGRDAVAEAAGRRGGCPAPLTVRPTMSA